MVRREVPGSSATVRDVEVGGGVIREPGRWWAGAREEGKKDEGLEVEG